MWFHEADGTVWHHDPREPVNGSLVDDPGTHRGGPDNRRWSRLLIADCGVVLLASSGTSRWGWMDEAGADDWIRKKKENKCSVCAR